MTYEEMQRMMEFILEQQAQLKANMRRLRECQRRMEASRPEDSQLVLRKPLIRPKMTYDPVEVSLRRAEEAVSKLGGSVSGR